MVGVISSMLNDEDARQMIGLDGSRCTHDDLRCH